MNGDMTTMPYEKGMKVLQLMWGAMIFSIGVYGAIAWMVRTEGVGPGAGDTGGTIVLALGAVSVGLFIAQIKLSRNLGDEKLFPRILDPGSWGLRPEAAEKLKVFWPNQNGQGAHVNISGIGLTTAARHRDNAVRLIEYLASTEAQTWYAEVNHEYPIRSNIPVSKTLAAMGKFKADTLNLHQLGQHNAEAVKLMDRAGWK